MIQKYSCLHRESIVRAVGRENYFPAMEHVNALVGTIVQVSYLASPSSLWLIKKLHFELDPIPFSHIDTNALNQAILMCHRLEQSAEVATLAGRRLFGAPLLVTLKFYAKNKRKNNHHFMMHFRFGQNNRVSRIVSICMFEPTPA